MAKCKFLTWGCEHILHQHHQWATEVKTFTLLHIINQFKVTYKITLSGQTKRYNFKIIIFKRLVVSDIYQDLTVYISIAQKRNIQNTFCERESVYKWPFASVLIRFSINLNFSSVWPWLTLSRFSDSLQ